MKALVRNPGETILETYGLTFIDWTTGAPLTNAGWFGGSYTLVNDYVPTVGEDDVEFEIQERGAGQEHYETETVTIDGKEYTRAELLDLLNNQTD